ncbi:PREDICTED: uncharacterized protein LOC105462497 [Wasmannia auropunctata]|uniref:uncharacterized protein LOC105462497 n=1 Tax=Wasmannia auropunctata TaxID=64793 RepID=UPI0005F0BE69|nr:PREDICTED: uncharacterized protein LOC105462497 [Wasmannia auropunctata]
MRMHLHRSGACEIALILTILAVTYEISWASKQCKTVVMDVHVKKCRLGAERIKRGLERLDLQKHDEKYETKRQEGPDYSKMKDSHGVPQKRQLTPAQIGGIAMPIVTQAIDGAAKARAYATSGAEYQDPSPSLTGLPFGWWPGYYLRAPYPFDQGLASFRASAFNDDLDLDLNAEELDELYHDIYERLPRASKDEAWKVFLETASKCCQNVDKCLKETMHVPCLGSQTS